MSRKIVSAVYRRKFIVLIVLLAAALAAVKNFFPAQAEQIAPAAVRFSENFDSLTAPQLPAGWTVTSTGTGAGFVVTTNNPDTAPNAIFTPAPATSGGTNLTSPPIYVSSTVTLLNFRHKYAMENTWDGGILEISVNGGVFQDIIQAGGSFLMGGYNNFLNPSTNPIGNRFAWTGATPGTYITTKIQLPSNTFRQFVQLRWRFGTNDNFGGDGWWIDSITMETISTAQNAVPVSIPSSGAASPYPSTIEISGMNGFVTGLVVDLGNFSHTSPDDVDVMLTAPNGRSIVLMSDAGGNNPANGVSMGFDDSALTSLPDNAPLTSDVFKPTNFEPGDTFPAPAPQNPQMVATLSEFYGSPPNGSWQLFIVDDNGNNVGTLAGGWSITLQSSLTACPFNISSTGQAFPYTGGSGSFDIFIPTGCGWTASSSSDFVDFTSPANGTGNSALNFNVEPNFGGGRTAQITVSNGILNRVYQIQQPSGCPFSLNQTLLNFPASGGAGNVAVTAGGVCIWQAESNANWIQVTSAPQNGDGTATFNVLPNTTSTARSATVTIGARTVTVNQAGATAKRFDFDGDAKDDISVFRSGTWYLLQSANGFSQTQFGVASDLIAPGDYDGDRKTDIAVFRDGTWYILESASGSVRIVQWGVASFDAPVPADYDGDGKTDIAVSRVGPELSSPRVFYILQSASNNPRVVQFGLTAVDKSVVGDYDGDGRADIAIYREAGGFWYILQSSNNNVRVEQFGAGNFQDKPVPRDYDGDGRMDFGVYRSGTWYLSQSTQGISIVNFGLSTDIPAAADYDGDAKTDIAVFRPSEGNWYLLRSQAGFGVVNFGLSGDVPVPSLGP